MIPFPTNAADNFRLSHMLHKYMCILHAYTHQHIAIFAREVLQAGLNNVVIEICSSSTVAYDSCLSTAGNSSVSAGTVFSVSAGTVGSACCAIGCSFASGT